MSNHVFLNSVPVFLWSSLCGLVKGPTYLSLVLFHNVPGGTCALRDSMVSSGNLSYYVLYWKNEWKSRSIFGWCI